MKGVHPIYQRSRLISGGKEVEFIYPSGLHWGCARCGACCRDPGHRPRRILLLPRDLERFREAGLSTEAVTRPADQADPFVAEMLKREGRCVLLGEGSCTAYGSRALLCRMYPFWVEKQGELLIIRHDEDCPGFQGGKPVTEEQIRGLLLFALEAMEGS